MSDNSSITAKGRIKQIINEAEYKPIPLLKTDGLQEAIETAASIASELQDMHDDHIPYGLEVATVCAYCGTRTMAPCCGENHHRDILVDRHGDEVSIPSKPHGL